MIQTEKKSIIKETREREREREREGGENYERKLITFRSWDKIN